MLALLHCGLCCGDVKINPMMHFHRGLDLDLWVALIQAGDREWSLSKWISDLREAEMRATNNVSYLWVKYPGSIEKGHH